MKDLLSATGNYFTSLTGIMTVLFILLALSRLILNSSRAKHGKDDQRYRNLKFAVGTFWAIFFVNALGIIWRHYSGAAWAFVTQSSWTAYTTLCIIYILSLAVSYRLLMIMPVWIISILTAYAMNEINIAARTGGFGLGDHFTGLGNVGLIIFAICALIIALIASDDIDGRRKKMAEKASVDLADESSKATAAPTAITSGQGVILGAVWLSSVILAYIAGEFSLIPKAQEFVKAKLQQRFATAKKASSAKDAPEPDPVPNDNTAS